MRQVQCQKPLSSALAPSVFLALLHKSFYFLSQLPEQFTFPYFFLLETGFFPSYFIYIMYIHYKKTQTIQRCVKIKGKPPITPLQRNNHHCFQFLYMDRCFFFSIYTYTNLLFSSTWIILCLSSIFHLKYFRHFLIQEA